MLKNLALVVFGLMSFAASPAFAYTSPADMEANFRACQNVPNWYLRFGRYVIAFDFDSANAQCSNSPVSARPKTVRCNLNGRWVEAGYVCEDAHGG